MHWMKALALLAAVSMLAAPIPAAANLTAAPMTLDYAAREAQAADLEGFTGGFHGVVITAFVIIVIVVLWLEVFDPHHGHGHHHRHHHGPVHP